VIGESIKRREDRRFLTGTGRFLDDIVPDGLLHLAVVRSPHAHARVVRVDAADAARRPGVRAVLTARDLPELTRPVPALIKDASFRPYQQPALAAERVRHVGEAVAVVVADDPYRAADAAEAVLVEYAPLPVAARAGLPPAPAPAILHDGWPDNVAGVSDGGVGDVTRGFAAAEAVVGARFSYPRVTGMPIETRGVVAVPERETGGITVWSSTQVPFNVRSAVGTVLGIPEKTVRVLAPDTGGGFGVKGHVYPEDVLVPAVARRLGRPVKWVETRREHLLVASVDRDQVHEARIGVRRDGTITAIETTFTRDHGAYPTMGEIITRNTINHLVGPYRVPHYRARGFNVVTNKTFAAAYRGAGRPEAALVLDRLLDRAARAIGMDPAELRRRNLVRPEEMPFVTGLAYRDGVPIAYDPADYVAAFDETLRRLDYAAWRKEQEARRGGPRPVGIGVSAYVEGTGIGPFEGADVSIDPGGTVLVDIGVSGQGQAHETTLAQICAAELGVPLERVVVRGGDTNLVGFGMGTIASRVAAVTGPAVARSAREVGRKARLVAAEAFECAAEDVVIADGHASVRGAPTRRLALGDLARAAVRSRALFAEGEPGLGACVFNYPETVTWAFGVQAAVVEVDLETCEPRVVRVAVVHDCGRPINPMVVDGQVHGGTAQGFGSALFEEVVHDDDGQVLTGSLMDYAIPRADSAPALDLGHVVFPSARNDLGIKGVGESGVIAPGAVVANAVEDALDGYGVEVDRLPVTPFRIYQWLRAGGRWPVRTPSPPGSA
jgi:carbon-monoxide dehydrogenase large subunit